jgi:Glutaminyl-tRNA synthetase, non-specific RNA binding region part 1
MQVVTSDVIITAALEYVLSNPTSIDVKKLEEAAGVGIIVTPEQIENAVEQALKKHQVSLLETRYNFRPIAALSFVGLTEHLFLNPSGTATTQDLSCRMQGPLSTSGQMERHCAVK